MESCEREHEGRRGHTSNIREIHIGLGGPVINSAKTALRRRDALLDHRDADAEI